MYIYLGLNNKVSKLKIDQVFRSPVSHSSCVVFTIVDQDTVQEESITVAEQALDAAGKCFSFGSKSVILVHFSVGRRGGWGVGQGCLNFPYI